MSQENHYFTIKEEAKGFYKEKGSKFLSFVFPVKTEEDVKKCLTKLKKEYHDARHHCYAYILGANGEKYRANDDGEPNNSAGMPILGQIRSNEVSNVLVVVIRYFGGIKLGISGLIRSYKIATALAFENAEIIQKFITETISIQCDYAKLNNVMHLVKEFKADIILQKMQLDCFLKIEIKKDNFENFSQSLTNDQIDWSV